MSATLPDPAAHSERACAGVEQDVFFPDLMRPRYTQLAQVICRGCPILQQCAAWAEPLVRSGDLHSCVIANVPVPPGTPSERNACGDALAAIARSSAEMNEGAA